MTLFEKTLTKYGGGGNCITQEYVQLPIDYIKACIEYCKSTKGFEDKIPSYKKDLRVLTSAQKKLPHELSLKEKVALWQKNHGGQ